MGIKTPIKCALNNFGVARNDYGSLTSLDGITYI